MEPPSWTVRVDCGRVVIVHREPHYGHSFSPLETEDLIRELQDALVEAKGYEPPARLNSGHPDDSWVAKFNREQGGTQ